MQMNKQRTLSVRMHSHSVRGTEVAMTKGQWLLSKLPECSVPKIQTTAPDLMHTPLYTPYPMHKHNACDVTKWCHNHLPPSFSRKKIAHAQESHTGLSAHLPVFLLTNFNVSYSYAWAISSILYPEFQACDIYIYHHKCKGAEWYVGAVECHVTFVRV